MQSENIVLYSTGCPKCKVLIAKLDSKNVDYNTISDINTIRDKGFSVVPMLEVDGVVMQFAEAVQWVNERRN